MINITIKTLLYICIVLSEYKEYGLMEAILVARFKR
jgi:hypothetical protein